MKGENVALPLKSLVTVPSDGELDVVTDVDPAVRDRSFEGVMLYVVDTDIVFDFSSEDESEMVAVVERVTSLVTVGGL